MSTFTTTDTSKTEPGETPTAIRWILIASAGLTLFLGAAMLFSYAMEWYDSPFMHLTVFAFLPGGVFSLICVIQAFRQLMNASSVDARWFRVLRWTSGTVAGASVSLLITGTFMRLLGYPNWDLLFYPSRTGAVVAAVLLALAYVVRYTVYSSETA